MKIESFMNGMTVAQLKRVVADWPETRANGEPCEVWMMDINSFTSSQVKEVWLLKKEGETADILFG